MSEDLEKLDKRIQYLEVFQGHIKESLKTVVNEYAKRSIEKSVRNLDLQIKFLYSKRERKQNEMEDLNHY